MKITKVAQEGQALNMCFEALGRQGGTVHQVLYILRAAKVLAETEYNEINQDKLSADLANLKRAYRE